MRGKVLRSDWAAAGYGITPAYAGKRGYPTLCTFAAWDHPRLCGEKERSTSLAAGKSGSPPPMRGKEKQGHDHLQRDRITPAYAGKRHIDYAPKAAVRDPMPTT